MAALLETVVVALCQQLQWRRALALLETMDRLDNNNDGSQPGGPGTPLFSPVINLSPGAESATDGDSDTDTNLTVDFGLWASMGVGNIVFIDINGDSQADARLTLLDFRGLSADDMLL